MKAKKTLQISIKAIPETGKDVSLDLGPEWFERWREEDPGLEFSQAAIRGTVNLSKHGHDILVRGRLEGELGLACGRCLEPFTAPVATDFDLLLVPGPPGRRPGRRGIIRRRTGSRFLYRARPWTWRPSSGSRSS